ncbi:hypothetical protein CYMTET_6931 [Cymbomonas tetramitiformis]|uniref:Sulfate exporter family transporter n=1 Tax=Cymbomonas tetramitiformis TaxID=36881 RepID=A0AAE0LHI6_9CHLO|nr:hypothetical protein CYMTET_6931 [Cymbomonas tetramitiformis]
MHADVRWIQEPSESDGDCSAGGNRLSRKLFDFTARETMQQLGAAWATAHGQATQATARLQGIVTCQHRLPALPAKSARRRWRYSFCNATRAEGSISQPEQEADPHETNDSTKTGRAPFHRRRRVWTEPRVSVSSNIFSSFTLDFWSSLDACEGFFSPVPQPTTLSRLRADDEEDEEERGEVAAPEFKAWAVDAGSLVPGMCVAVVVMQAGFAIAGQLGAWLLASQGLAPGASSPISGIPVTILLGVVLNSVVQLPPALVPGLQYCVKKVLRLGIVCVGIKLSAVEVMAVGGAGVPVVMICIAVGLSFILWFSQQMSLSRRLGALLAAGTSICGVTAITALAPAIKATRREMGVAVANVVVCGTLGMLVYPVLAHLLLHSSTQVGLFLGTGIHDTAQVIGAALTYREIYGDELVLKVATVTKLTRNLFLAVVMPILALWNLREQKRQVDEAEAAAAAALDSSGLGAPATAGTGFGSEDSGEKPQYKASVETLFPMFILGFLVMSGFRSIGDANIAGGGLAYGLLDTMQWKSVISFIGDILGSRFMLGIAMAGVGLGTNIKVFKGVGVKPFLVGITGSLVVASAGFLCAVLLG